MMPMHYGAIISFHYFWCSWLHFWCADYFILFRFSRLRCAWCIIFRCKILIITFTWNIGKMQLLFRFSAMYFHYFRYFLDADYFRLRRHFREIHFLHDDELRLFEHFHDFHFRWLRPPSAFDAGSRIFIFSITDYRCFFPRELTFHFSRMCRLRYADDDIYAIMPLLFSMMQTLFSWLQRHYFRLMMFFM